jgi:DNA-binding LytR/AlgR family response regulator
LFSAVDGNEYFIRSTIPNTLKYYIPESIKQKFIQLNRAEMVNIDYIQEVSADFVVTKFNKIAFSESNGKELKKRLNILS